MNFSKVILILLSIFTLHGITYAGGDPLADFGKWEIHYLSQSYLNCSEPKLSLYDEFEGNELSDIWQTNLYKPDDQGLYARLHTNHAEEIFMQDNVRVENSLLKLTARWETVSWQGVQRDISSGMVQTKKGFNLGRYEIRCKMPPQPHVWTAFWVWSIEEIDIIDVATRKYYSNAIHGNGYSESHPERDLAVDLSDGFHTYACEWTPFKVEYFFDGRKTATFYRYYKRDKTPLDINCGDKIPQGVYKLNPAFPELSRQFKPIAWIAIEKACWHGDCDCDDDHDPNTHCGPKINLEDLPSTYEVDYIKVEERAYDIISLNPDCLLDLNPYGHAICINLKSKPFNTNLPQNQYEVIAWEISDNVKINTHSHDQICLIYQKPLESTQVYRHWLLKNNIILKEWELPLITFEKAFHVKAVIKNETSQIFPIDITLNTCFTKKDSLLQPEVWKIINTLIFYSL